MTRSQIMVYLHAKDVPMHISRGTADKVVDDPWEIRIRQQIHNPLGHRADPVGRDNVSRERSSHESSLPVWIGSVWIEDGD